MKKILLLSFAFLMVGGQGASEASDRLFEVPDSSRGRYQLIKGPRPLRVLSTIGNIASVVCQPLQRSFHSNAPQRLFYSNNEI